MADDMVSRRITRSLASKQKSKRLSEENQRKPPFKLKRVERDVETKKKSCTLTLSWQKLMQLQTVEEDNSAFYEKMIRWSYDLPSDDDDEKRQFRLEQQGIIEKKSRRFTPKERKIYTEKVQSSQGFDVVDVPDHIFEYNLIKPYPEFEENSRIFERVKYSAKLALHLYNKEHEEKKYQFVKVLKVNLRSAAGCIFYITFEAKPMMDRDAPPENFQARVYAGITVTKVDFCRPEQNSS